MRHTENLFFASSSEDEVLRNVQRKRKERKKRYGMTTATSKRKMAIFIDFKFEDLEVMYPKIRLEEEGVEVHVVGGHPKGMKYTGTHRRTSRHT